MFCVRKSLTAKNDASADIHTQMTSEFPKIGKWQLIAVETPRTKSQLRPNIFDYTQAARLLTRRLDR